MIAKLKKTALGELVYRLSRSALGWPLRRLSIWLQSEAFQLEHLSSVNRKHNQTQIAILEQFETETETR